MILTALCLTFIVFFLTNLYPNLEKLAKTQGNAACRTRSPRWLDRNGYGGPMILRYGEWLGVVPGWTRFEEQRTNGVAAASNAADTRRPRRASAACCRAIWGFPPCSRTRSAASSAERLQLTGILMFWVLIADGADRR
jgi:peptide/nickel transport system permease protein